MKQILQRLVLLVLVSGMPALAASKTWQPAQGPLMTRWAAEVSPRNAHPEYPRPQMVRADWQNLNGLWAYAVTDRAAAAPTTGTVKSSHFPAALSV